jgi:uncharacterized protein (DUF2147 family)
MNWRKSIFLAICATFGSTVTFAQSNVGDLLDAGAAKLSKADILAMIIGANISGPTQTGGINQTDYKSDGTYTGTYQGSPGAGRGQSGGYFGKWTLDDGGKLCTEGYAGPGAKAVSNCVFFFRLGDQLYVALNSDSDRSTVVLKRAVKR